MKKNSSERRLIENELLLRNSNMKAKDALKKYFAPDKKAETTPIQFHCECSKVNCGKIISLTITEYEKLHKKRDQFVLYRGHEIRDIEKPIKELTDYVVVEKFAIAA